MLWNVEKKIGLGFAVTLSALLAVGVLSYLSTRKLIRDSNLVAHAHEVLHELQNTLSTLKDAEAGQRGYIITGDEQYLGPYRDATVRIEQNVARLRELTAVEPAQQERLAPLERKIRDRFSVLSEGVELRRSGGFAAAEGLVASGRGKRLMDEIRGLLAEMSAEEDRTLERRREESNASARRTTVTLTILGVLLLGLLPAGYLIIRRDLDHRRRAERALRESEDRYKHLIEHAGEIIYRTDERGNLLFVNPTTVELLKYAEEELIGQHYSKLIKPEFRETAEKFYGRQLVKKVPNTYLEVPVVTKDGRELWVGQNGQLVWDGGRVVGFQAIARDVTERRRAVEELQSLSLTDDLTGLYNRRGFLTLAEQQLKHVQRAGEKAVLVFADLDGLKQINDRHGHQEGSNAIVSAARVLRQTFRESDVLARLGGDEFTVLATVAGSDDTESIRARLQQNLRAFNARQDLPYDLSMSVGLAALDPRSDISIEELIRRADAKMYEQKQAKEKVKR